MRAYLFVLTSLFFYLFAFIAGPARAGEEGRSASGAKPRVVRVYFPLEHNTFYFNTLSEALSAVETPGTTAWIYLPPGKFTLAKSKVTLLDCSLTLIGTGIDTSVLTSPLNDEIFELHRSTLSMEDLSLEIGAGEHAAIRAFEKSHVDASTCLISVGESACGMALAGASKCTLRFCEIRGKGNGIVQDGGELSSDHCTLSTLHGLCLSGGVTAGISGNKFTTCRSAIIANGASRVDIFGNDFYQCNCGVWIGGLSVVEARSNTFSTTDIVLWRSEAAKDVQFYADNKYDNCKVLHKKFIEAEHFVYSVVPGRDCVARRTIVPSSPRTGTKICDFVCVRNHEQWQMDWHEQEVNAAAILEGLGSADNGGSTHCPEFSQPTTSRCVLLESGSWIKNHDGTFSLEGGKVSMRSGSAVSTCLRPEWVPDYPYTECEAILSLRFSQQPPADFFQLPLAEQCLPHAAEVVSPHGTLGQVISKALGSTIAIATVHHLPLPPALPTRGQVEEAFKKLRARVGAGGFAEQHRLSPDQCYLRAEAMAQYLLKNKLPAYKIFVYPNTFCNDPDTQQDYCYHVAACVPCSDMQGNITVLMFDPWWSPSELPVTVELWLRQNGARQGAHHVDILSWMTFCPIEANDNENSQFIYRMIQQALEGNLYGK